MEHSLEQTKCYAIKKNSINLKNLKFFFLIKWNKTGNHQQKKLHKLHKCMDNELYVPE